MEPVMRAIKPRFTLRGMGLSLKISAPLDSPQCRPSKNIG
jgi:hypothetical protein